MRDGIRDFLMSYQESSEDTTRLVFDGGESFSILRSSVLCCLPNRVVILDGTARYSNVKWPDFKIVSLEEHSKLRFDNVSIHPKLGNSTRKHIKQSFGEFSSEVLFWINERQRNTGKALSVSLLSNKDDIDKWPELNSLQRDLIKTGNQVINLEQGSIIGSNEGRDTEVVLIVVSMFTSLDDYCLRTVLRTGENLKKEDIWKIRNVPAKEGRPAYTETSVNMDKGFVCEAIDDTFRRHYANVMIQYLMRSRARRYDGRPVNVFCYVADEWLYEELMRVLPGIRIAGYNGSLLNKLKAMPKERLENMEDAELTQLAGITTKYNQRVMRDLRRKLVYAWKQAKPEVVSGETVTISEKAEVVTCSVTCSETVT
jgi:hypothetical protein